MARQPSKIMTPADKRAALAELRQEVKAAKAVVREQKTRIREAAKVLKSTESQLTKDERALAKLTKRLPVKA